MLHVWYDWSSCATVFQLAHSTHKMLGVFEFLPCIGPVFDWSYPMMIYFASITPILAWLWHWSRNVRSDGYLRSMNDNFGLHFFDLADHEWFLLVVWKTHQWTWRPPRITIRQAGTCWARKRYEQCPRVFYLNIISSGCFAYLRALEGPRTGRPLA